jgi:hypothetical protein
MGSQPRPGKRSRKSATPSVRGEGPLPVPAAGPLITIRARNDANKPFEPIVVERSKANGQQMVLMARHWGYILRVRTRWAGNTDMRDHFGSRAIDDLAKLKITEENIRDLALATHIEIELGGWKDEATGTRAKDGKAKDKPDPFEAASEIPWEYLFSAATRKVGRFQSLLISRWFSAGPAARSRIMPKVTPAPRRFLFVESAPGRIGYKFEDEETRIEAAVKRKEGKGLTFSKTEPFSDVEKKVLSNHWDAIHITGVDTHQAAWLIDGFYDEVARKADVIDESNLLHDGMILRGDKDSELPVRYDELADLLLGTVKWPGAPPAARSRVKRPRRVPDVVTLNLYYSGARTARELVRRGVYAAIGFLDEIDDEFAERFFQAFYWAWCHDKKSIPACFLKAWGAMDSDRMHGTAIVIWLGRSAFDTAAPPQRARAPRAVKKTVGAR